MDKLFVYLIGTYVIKRKGWKDKLHLKAVTMIYHVTWWFEITHYNNKIAISIANLVETTCLSRYTITMEIHMTKYHNLLVMGSENP